MQRDNTGTFWKFKQTPILHAFKDNIWKFTYYFTEKQTYKQTNKQNKDNFALNNTPYFTKSRMPFQKYPYLHKNENIIQKTTFSKLIFSPLTTRSFKFTVQNDFDEIW